MAKQYLTVKEAALFMGFTSKALDNWRCRSVGPAYLRIEINEPGHAYTIRYKLDDLVNFMERHRVAEGRMPQGWRGRPRAWRTRKAA